MLLLLLLLLHVIVLLLLLLSYVELFAGGVERVRRDGRVQHPVAGADVVGVGKAAHVAAVGRLHVGAVAILIISR